MSNNTFAYLLKTNFCVYFFVHVFTQCLSVGKITLNATHVYVTVKSVSLFSNAKG